MVKYRDFMVLYNGKIGDILLKLSPIPTAKLLKKQDRKPVGGQYEKIKKKC